MTWSRKPKAWTPPAGREQEILARIESRAEEVGDCLLVQSKSRRPQYRETGGNAVSIQRAVWALRGNTLAEGDCVTSRCGDPCCISPDHLMALSRERMAKRASGHARRGNEALRAMKIAAASAHRQKVSDAQVIEIRCSTDPTADLASRYGVSESLVKRIRSGKTRRTVVAGMWSQLMGRSA